jgi:3-dehydroquinate dehydratase-2
MAKILVLHGPNLNLLGSREPEHYGPTLLQDIDQRLIQATHAAGHELASLQSNAEHVLVERVQQAASDGTVFIIINPAAFTHTSVALRDALAAVALPFIEVHLSNVHAREAFRRQSYFSELAVGVISGLGAQGYELALQAALWHIDSKKSDPNPN